VADDGEIMGDEQIREAELLLEPFEEIDDLGLDRHVERRDRLVAHDEARAECQCPREADALTLTLAIRNDWSEPFRFEEAFHTYLPVSDIRTARIQGLGGASFIDKTDSLRRKSLPDGDLILERETDSVFEGSQATVRIVDPASPQTMVVDKQNSASTIVWNPWAEKGSSLSDLGAAWERMICVESANAGADSVTVAPGETHVMQSTIRVQTPSPK